MRTQCFVLTGLVLLLSGEAEGKRGKRAEEVSAVVVPALSSEERGETLSTAYHSRHAFLEREGKRRTREYKERLKNCSAGLGKYNLCSSQRISELEERARVGEAELKELRRDYVEIMKQSGFSGEMNLLLDHYHAGCIAKKGKGNSSYCQELAGEILKQGAGAAKSISK